MSTPEPTEPNFHGKPHKIVVYHKRDAARTQLETAIALWFHYGDAMAIHTLAAAANECYHGIGSKLGAPGIVQTWKKSLSKKDRDFANLAQNFGKHANTDPAGTLRLRREHAELLILDSIMCHERIFGSGKRTALMTCFFARFVWENPRLATYINASRREQGRDDLTVDDAIEGNRMEFLKEVLPVLRARIGEQGPTHGDPSGPSL